MSNSKVKRSMYKKLTQDQLNVFAKDFLDNTVGNETYTDISEKVLAVQEKAAKFNAALAKAYGGGKILVFEKNKAKEQLVAALDGAADGLDYFAEGDESYIVDTGMETKSNSRRTSISKERPEMPTNVNVEPQKIQGCLKVTFKLVNPKHVLAVAAEWSQDGGVTWNNGNYFSGQKGLMENLPSLTRVMVRFRAIGRGDLKSQWTIPMTVPVL